MASDQDRKDFARRGTQPGTGNPTPIKPMPKLADYLGPVLPHAVQALERYDAAMEEWRKSVVAITAFPP